MSLKTLVSFLDAELGLSDFPKDESLNGLQVQGREKIRTVGLAVDACQYVFQEASRKQVDFLFVHHGLIWGGIKSLRGLMRDRVKMLLDAGISLYACHLPLDWHPSYGNNAELLRILSIRNMGEFGEYHGRKIGYWGRAKKDTLLSQFVAEVNALLKTKSSVIDFGKKVRNVGVVSGGGWSAITEADKLGIDTFLTGEPSHSAYTLAEEMKVNLVFAGHYATETPGVKACGRLMEKKFGLAVEFIDHPTGL
ncbi:MAG: Nif3-like dinuclear metal center hexameric protein [Nitrospirae bacterium]|nr:Nif3-like dinuclear metal center hexameric protein [Nitrospirota bacterium]